MNIGCLPGVLAGLLALLLAGCTLSPAATPTGAPTPTPSTQPTASPTPAPTPGTSPSPTASLIVLPSVTPTRLATPPATPSPGPTLAAVGLPSATCINGWVRPAEGDPHWVDGLQILMNYMGLTSPLSVDDMVYFVGPDPDNILDPRFEHVERWYIKATLSTDPTYRGRWLVEKRTNDRLGVSAVAPYETVGYESPDWSGFEGDGEPRAIPGLPGLWGGIQYDFVTGEGDSGFPGLPTSQSECLFGT